MNRYIQNLIKELYNLYNFNILEIGNITGSTSKWGVYSIYNNNLNVVLFSDLDHYRQIDTNILKVKLHNIIGYSNLTLTIVLLENDTVSIQQKISNLIGYPQCELILIDVNLNRILYYSESANSFVYKISNCINKLNNHNKHIDKNGKFSIRGSEITYFIAALNIIFYIITAILSKNIFSSDINVLVYMGAKVNQFISSGQYYRLILCMFLHGGIVHLVLNMYALVAIGPLVEKIYGKLKYIFIYFFSGIIASIFSYIFSPSISIGASGAIFGLFGATLIFALKMKERINKEFIYSIFSVIAVNLILGFSVANVDNFGHVGGLIGGIVSSLILKIGKNGDS
ncbi:rhomboid family intramembrane serine protease [Clostridium tyrobutyricum]|uniref:rhomboid family intramembrane serine protease n=1 Tax=Clostridium tyrobutyricum TaxID=1519 RepID=UPI001C3926BF|nr:rhomboid family intramembrane serine protease [Clostridium tyrobutyricum]MBV4441438.1 rhomboid family intramembrane serine protease [Clostridium tyrobutyricum]